MTLRQRFLEAIYPIFMATIKVMGRKHGVKRNKMMKQPEVSFYTLQCEAINGAIILFDTLRGKKVLLVNTASDCGYTAQYDDLEKLHRKHGNEVVVIAFPANDFKEQEKSNDEDIATFCRKNFGVTFTLMKKSIVVKNANQNEVYKWLTNADKNGWNNKQPEWNFTKFLVNENGVLTHYFSPSISPLSREVLKNL